MHMRVPFFAVAKMPPKIVAIKAAQSARDIFAWARTGGEEKSI